MAEMIPGVIVRIVNDTGVIVPPLVERYPVIIGEGDPYRIITNEKKIRGTGDADTLSTPTSAVSIVSVGDLPGISGYTATTDYTLSGNTIDWTGAASEPTAGDSYYVTYTDTRPTSAYSPTLYFDENLIYADHGNGIRTDGTINDVSVGGSLAINAGAKGVIIAQLNLSGAVDPDNPTNSELETAFTVTKTALEQIYDYKLFLVPMSSGTLNTTSAANIFFNHAVLASQPEMKQERTVIAAMPTSSSYTTIAAFAESYAHERMVVPAVKDTTIQVTGYTGTYDMRFYNAALAGLLCSGRVGDTFSDEIVPNVTFTSNYSVDVLNYLVQRGVSPGKIRGEVVRNVLAITTDTTNALTEDLGVQDIKDYTKKAWREWMFSTFKNRRINADLLDAITAQSRNFLETLISEEILADFRNVSVTQDETEPRKVLATAKILPAYSFQWGDVTFTFSLSFSS